MAVGLNIRGGGPVGTCGADGEGGSGPPSVGKESGWTDGTDVNSSCPALPSAEPSGGGEYTLRSRASPSASGTTTGGGGDCGGPTANGVGTTGASSGKRAMGPPGVPAEAGVGLLRLRMPGLERGSCALFRGAIDFAPFFLLAFRSSLCFRRNSALSAFEIPSSTNGPVVLT